jgi:hypothetical protein
MRLFSILISLAILYSCGNNKPNNYGKSWSKIEQTDSIQYLGGDGSNIKEAVIVKNAKTELDGMNALFNWIQERHGLKFVEWKMKGRSESKNESNIPIENYTIIDEATNKEYTYFFNTTDFRGKTGE